MVRLVVLVVLVMGSWSFAQTALPPGFPNPLTVYVEGISGEQEAVTFAFDHVNGSMAQYTWYGASGSAAFQVSTVDPWSGMGAGQLYFGSFTFDGQLVWQQSAQLFLFQVDSFGGDGIVSVSVPEPFGGGAFMVPFLLGMLRRRS
jgi:hypothetical protein